MIPTARAMRTALPASGSADNAFLIATVPMPASPITSAAMRAALPDMARAPASAVGGGGGAPAAPGGGNHQAAAPPRTGTPPQADRPPQAAAGEKEVGAARTPPRGPHPERRDGGRVARYGAGAGVRGRRGSGRHGGRGGEQQQACVPAEIEHAARAERPPQCGRGVQDVRDAEDP